VRTLAIRISVVLVTVSTALVLSAQNPDSQNGDARNVLNRGVSAFKAGNTQQAVDLFTRSSNQPERYGCRTLSCNSIRFPGYARRPGPGECSKCHCSL